MAYEYNPKIAENCKTQCPPQDATPTDLEIYRAVGSIPPKNKDFLSDIETKKKGRNVNVCAHWGCSVWPNYDAAKHARDLFDWLRIKYIVKGKLHPGDGQILPTPTREQPKHRTFWKDSRIDVSGKFSVAFKPIEDDNQ